MSSSSLKEQKELFVTGLEGTTAGEVLLVCATSATGAWFYLTCCSCSCSCSRYYYFLNKHAPTASSILWEVVAFTLPMILCQTVYLYPYGVAYLILQVAMGLVFLCVPLLRRDRTAGTKTRKYGTLIVDSSQQQCEVVSLRRRSSITIYRSSLLLLTAIAILAVDFRVFPRRFGKTESAGYGLMDLGAASFVVAAGLVSPRARRFNEQQQQQQQQQQQSSGANTVSWKRTLPVLGLGLLRWTTHRELEYQEHVSEYGVHWNFFWTLALLAPTARALRQILGQQQRSPPSWIVPTVLLTVYQFPFLLWNEMQEWIETAPRSCPRAVSVQPTAALCHFAFANREGLLGLLSFACIYLLSEWMAYTFLWNCSYNSAATKSPLASPFSLAVQATRSLWWVVAALLGVWQLLTRVLDVPVSRRSTNAPFAAWVLLVNLLLLSCIDFVVQLVYALPHERDASNSNNNKSDSQRTIPLPPVLDAMNRHGLLTFVIANLLTGAVNLSINTLQVEHRTALLILWVYTSAVGAVALLLDRVFPRTRSSRTGKKMASD